MKQYFGRETVATFRMMRSVNLYVLHLTFHRNDRAILILQYWSVSFGVVCTTTLTLNKWMDEWMKERKEERTNEGRKKRMNGRKERRIDGWQAGRLADWQTDLLSGCLPACNTAFLTACQSALPTDWWPTVIGRLSACLATGRPAHRPDLQIDRLTESMVSKGACVSLASVHQSKQYIIWSVMNRQTDRQTDNGEPISFRLWQSAYGVCRRRNSKGTDKKTTKNNNNDNKTKH